MGLTRRELLAGMGAAAAQAPGQGLPPAPKEGPRSRPIVCLFSQHMIQLQYSELGPALRDLGFDGCDLTVRPGGHVIPEKASADLLRAIESLRGDGIAVPMITTALTTAADPTARPVVGIAGMMKVPLFVPGYWHYGPGNVEARLAQVRSELGGLALLGRAYGMAAAVPNRSGDYVGEAVWDIRAMIAGMDPNFVGYCFDAAYATASGGAGGWEIALRVALPRLRIVSLRDFVWDQRRIRMCPMGQGLVDWPRLFALLAEARFTGPLSLHLEYAPDNDIKAMQKDLEFVRKQIEAAYGGGEGGGQKVSAGGKKRTDLGFGI